MTLPGFWEKLYLITWKNWRITYVYRFSWCIATVIPCLFVAILLIIRLSTGVQHYGKEVYKPINMRDDWKKMTQRIAASQAKLASHGIFIHDCFLPQLTVAYAPNIAVYSDLMQFASTEYLDNIKLIGFESNEALRAAMEEEHFLAGVSFHIRAYDYYHDSDDELLNLNYSLIFPSELRIFADTFIGQSWRTNTLLCPYAEVERTNSTENAHYVREGFIALQNAVSMAFIHEKAANRTLPHVQLNQFPRKERIYDPMLTNLPQILPFLITFGYLTLLAQFSIRLVVQKIAQRKQMFRIFGISNTIHTITWLICGYLWFLFPSICLVIILKIGSSDFKICRNSSWLALFLFCTCFNIASIGFCFMMSSLVRNLPNVMLFVGIFWVWSFMPYYLTFKNPSGPLDMFLFIFSNTLMAVGFKDVFELEKIGEGLQMYNLFRSADFESVGFYGLVLLLLCILYTSLGIALEKIPIWLMKIWLKQKFTFLKSTSRISESEDDPPVLKSSGSFIRSRTQVLEIKNERQVVLVELINLTKKYDGVTVVDNVSLSFYEGEISVVMGHNGSGKTTLLSMIAGVIRPTSGSIVFNDEVFSIVTQDGINIGIGIQNMLHPGLTVANEIMLHCRLKGLLRHDEVKEDADKYMEAMDLKGVANVLISHLSDGLKRHVIVCCALCGNSKFVVMDEPSTNMDAMAKIKFWDLIAREKHNRTIILSTHSVREAEILADHLLVMSSGKVQCYGSVYFLKSIYGRGYRLICMKAPGCSSSNITGFLRNFIPYIAPESDIGKEISFRLHERYFEMFPKLLNNLEESFEQLDIIGCSFSEPIVEDIVILMGSEDSTKTEGFRFSEVLRGYTIYREEYINYTFTRDFVPYKGFKLFCSQLHAMFFKHFYSRSHIDKVLHYILLPAFTILITFLTLKPLLARDPLHATTIRMTQYTQSVTAVYFDTKSNYDQKVFDSFTHYFHSLPWLSVVHKLDIVKEKSITDHLLDIQTTNLAFNSQYLIGVSYERNYITAWFNSYWLHTAPLSLNLLHNSLLAIIHYNGRIIVNNDPLPYSTTHQISGLSIFLQIENILPMIITCLVSLIYPHHIFYGIHERRMKFKLTQYICGIHHITYYLGAILYDAMKITVISMSVLFIILFFQTINSYMSRFAVYCFLIMIVFGICISPVYYLLSIYFDNSSLGYAYICLHGIFGVCCYIALIEPITHRDITQRPLPTSYKLLSYILPHFTLCKSLAKVFTVGKARAFCANKDIQLISQKLDECVTIPYCCIELNEFSWTHWGIYSEICYFAIIGLLSATLLLIYEFQDRIRGLLGYITPLDDIDLAMEDYKQSHEHSDPYQKSIINERLRVENLLPSKFREKPIVLTNVTKLFKGRRVGVSRMTLLLEEGECFGLIGINGSGKSTLIKLLIGEETLSSGRAYVHGNSVLDELSDVYKYIGYCPSLYGYSSQMTCRQVLQFFCRLRGTPLELIGPISENLGKILGIMRNFDKRIYNISPGIKQRLRAAITLIGHPSILFFDKHVVGIDPAGRRQFWNILSRLQNFGTTILFTAQSPFDPERFCTRIGFIHKGSLLCVDNLHHLQTTQSKIYILQIKLKPTSTLSFHQLEFEDEDLPTTHQAQRSSLPMQINNVQTFMATLYPKSELKHHHGLFLSYRIPAEDTSVSQIFKKVKRHAFFLKVDNFSVKWETISILFSEVINKDKMA